MKLGLVVEMILEDMRFWAKAVVSDLGWRRGSGVYCDHGNGDVE